MKNKKITGFYIHTDISRTAHRYLKNFYPKISLDEGTKFIYKFSNNKPTMVYQQCHKYFSTELSPILLDVYDSLKKLGTMAATSRTGTICVTYKFKLHKSRLQNFHFNPQESYAKTLRCNYWWKPIRCYQKHVNITHIFHNSRCNWCPISVKSCFNVFEFSSIFHRIDWVASPW